jgi:hypothetical protein
VMGAAISILTPLLMWAMIELTRRDILRNLVADNGTIDRKVVSPKGSRIHNKAPRVIDDATAFRIEQEQTARNARDYR